MEIVPVVGIVVAAIVIMVLAYLYRESAILEGKTEVSVGPWKFKLGGTAQKEMEPELVDKPAEMPAPKIEQSPTELGHIEDSAPEIHGHTGEIKQTASGSGPEIP